MRCEIEMVELQLSRRGQKARNIKKGVIFQRNRMIMLLTLNSALMHKKDNSTTMIAAYIQQLLIDVALR